MQEQKAESRLDDTIVDQRSSGWEDPEEGADRRDGTKELTRNGRDDSKNGDDVSLVGVYGVRRGSRRDRYALR